MSADRASRTELAHAIRLLLLRAGWRVNGAVTRLLACAAIAISCPSHRHGAAQVHLCGPPPDPFGAETQRTRSRRPPPWTTVLH